MDILKLILTALLSVAAMFIIAKLMGHKQIAQLNFFDYVSGITVGSIAAELATELEEPEKPLIALVIWGAVSLMLSFLTNKLPCLRKYVNGKPTVLLEGGKLNRKNLKSAKLDLGDFLMLCREQGYFDISEIHIAVFEPTGKLSILPTSTDRPATLQDLGITAQPTQPAHPVIMDGVSLPSALGRLGRDENWLSQKLRASGYKAPSDILLATLTPDGTLQLYPNE